MLIVMGLVAVFYVLRLENARPALRKCLGLLRVRIGSPQMLIVSDAATQSPAERREGGQWPEEFQRGLQEFAGEGRAAPLTVASCGRTNFWPRSKS